MNKPIQFRRVTSYSRELTTLRRFVTVFAIFASGLVIWLLIGERLVSATYRETNSVARDKTQTAGALDSDRPTFKKRLGRIIRQ